MSEPASPTILEDRSALARGASPRMRRWIYVLEDLFRIPFTQVTFGLDVILGLLPVVGDFAGLICGLPIVAAAVRRRLPFRVILVMLANVLLDAVAGSVPILGNLFDLFWKAHRRNLELLERPGALAQVLREASGRFVALAAVVFLLALALAALLVWFFWFYIRVVSRYGLAGL